MSRAAQVLMWVGVIGLISGIAGCQGERLSSLVERPLDSGRWRVDGMLIRSYNVSLEQAYEAALALAQKNNWLVVRSHLRTHTASVDLKTRELVDIHVAIWAPPEKATDIGIIYGRGERVGSIRIFEQLETALPGKRITVNQP